MKWVWEVRFKPTDQIDNDDGTVSGLSRVINVIAGDVQDAALQAGKKIGYSFFIVQIKMMMRVDNA